MTRDNRDEREFDPLDTADAYVLLDGGEARLGLSECCNRFVCTCGLVGEPEHRRNYKPAATRTIRTDQT